LNITDVEVKASLTNSIIAQANPMRPVCEVMIIYEQVSLAGEMSIVCYSPASQKSNTPLISIVQPIDTLDE
jgi:hypothetical protein